MNILSERMIKASMDTLAKHALIKAININFKKQLFRVKILFHLINGISTFSSTVLLFLPFT